MTIRRIVIVLGVVVCVALCCAIAPAVASQQAAGRAAGPALGTWKFAGEDAKGVAWTGTLVVEKLDTDRFDAATYYAIVTLDLRAGSGQRVIEEPCRWDPAKREIAFRTGLRSAPTEFTASLSADGKSLAGGKWTESEQDRQTMKMTVKNSGTWSATLGAK